MVGLYPNVDVYTRQLRDLEEFRRQNPNDASAHFLLAYHYLTMGNKDTAVGMLEKVTQLQPDDKLSAALLKALTTGESGGATPPPPAAAR
jgi:cytochrome c-type biogenesis protein CcmH/NrfG